MPDAAATTPVRPASVPYSAVWETAHELWRLGETDDAGQWHGPQRTFRRDGSLIGEFDYVAGKPHGRFRRYHPTGEVSIEGEHSLGIPTGERLTFRSSGASDEAVHSCCLPTRAVKVVTRYEVDGRILEDFFDVEGHPILPTGERHPTRPPEVPSGARLDQNTGLWVDGAYDRARRHGSFTFWNESGSVVERADFKHGHLDGLRERYVNGEIVERRMYKAGELDGPAWERVPVGRFESPAIVAHEGYYEKGTPAGKWRYLSATGRIVATVDLGTPLREVPLDDAILLTVTNQDDLSLCPAREHLRRLVDAAHTGERAALAEVAGSIPQLSLAVSAAWMVQLRDGNDPPAQQAAKLLAALLRGLRAEHALRGLSLLFLRQPSVGLQLLSVSLGLAPEELETRAAEVLFLTGLGRIEGARRKIAAMVADHPRQAAELRFNLDVTYPAFTYWPGRTTVGAEVSPDLPSVVAQPLPALREALAKAAKRLCLVRTAIEALVPPAEREFELPPDFSAWTRMQPEALEDFTFTTEDGDSVEVRETLKLDGCSLPELMLQARTEWTTLCWLLYACGVPHDACVREDSLPERAETPPAFQAALTLAFQELYRVTDQLQTSGIRSRNQGVPDCTWEGVSVSSLSRSLLFQAFSEYRERRAALFFAADATCRSVWQDDLRAT